MNIFESIGERLNVWIHGKNIHMVALAVFIYAFITITSALMMAFLLLLILSLCTKYPWTMLLVVPTVIYVIALIVKKNRKVTQ